MTTFRIPDKRSTDPEAYKHEFRLGRLKNSWRIGAEKRNQEELTFEEGFTWGSIGQILGYLLGEAADEAYQEKLWEQLLAAFKATERGKELP